MQEGDDLKQLEINWIYIKFISNFSNRNSLKNIETNRTILCIYCLVFYVIVHLFVVEVFNNCLCLVCPYFITVVKFHELVNMKLSNQSLLRVFAFLF